MKTSLKEKALKLRQEGWSYALIHQKLNVSKSTLSGWLGGIPFVPNSEVLSRIKAGPAKSGRVSSLKKGLRIQLADITAREELGLISRRDLWMLGIGLYIGEGGKVFEDTRISNSDPDVIKLAVAWFTSVMKVPRENMYLRLHIYPDVSEHAAISYWSGITGVPPVQFRRSHVDLRTNKLSKNQKKLPYGTAHLGVKSCGKEEFGVKLHRRIMAWINESYKQSAGIV